MRTLGVAVSKGGTGKTTVAVHIAHGLAIAGARVLLIDADPQGHAGAHLGHVDTSGDAGDLVDVIENRAGLVDVGREVRPGLVLIPSGGDRLASHPLSDPLSLSQAVDSVRRRFDAVVIDAAPGWDALNVAALVAVRELVIPIVPEVLAVRGLGMFLERVERVRAINPRLSLRLIVPNLVDMRPRQTADVIGQLRELFPDKVAEPIRRSVRVSESAGLGQTVFETAARSTVADDFRALVERVNNG